nr:transcriptional regulator NrdR [uncultured Lichenicoccus sp.]
MRCPFCGHEDTQVKDSRPNEDGAAIRRRRFCASCGQRFTTIERVQLRELMVTKVDGRRVPFERDKLARSIRIAMRKRPIDEDRIERIVNGLVRQLEASGEVEIASKQLGELVMDTLREVDAVAYVRFASVYRDFREARDFEAILGSLPSLPIARAETAQLSTRAEAASLSTRAEAAPVPKETGPAGAKAR